MAVNLDSRAAEASYTARVQLYEWIRASFNPAALQARLIAQASNENGRVALKAFFAQVHAPVVSLRRGLSERELGVILDTGWVANRVDYGTFASAANIENFTSAGDVSRKFVVVFQVPRFQVQPAGYDWSIADQGARIPDYNYLVKLVSSGGKSTLSRADYEGMISRMQAIQARGGRLDEFTSYLKHVHPSLTQDPPVFTLLQAAFEHRFGKFPAEYLDVEATLKANEGRLDAAGEGRLRELLGLR
ncbi:MAG: hypothetical protein AB7F66_17190 [Bacteriovoracia bacterium]